MLQFTAIDTYRGCVISLYTNISLRALYFSNLEADDKSTLLFSSAYTGAADEDRIL